MTRREYRKQPPTAKTMNNGFTLDLPPRKIYVAASVHNRTEAVSTMLRLYRAGFEPVSTWTDKVSPGYHGRQNPLELNHITWNAWASFCEKACDGNVAELDECDTLLILTGDVSSSGGRHFEMGYAMAKGKNILLVGYRENPFAFHRSIAQAPDLETALSMLEHSRSFHAEQVLNAEKPVNILEQVPCESVMCRDVREFMEKFEIPRQGMPSNRWRLSDDEQEFRSQFLIEELNEYLSAVGCFDTSANLSLAGKPIQDRAQDAAKALDALVDLVYVALGNAYMHGFDFDAAWQLVQEANMRKIKVASSIDSAHSTGRGNKFDVKKPEGWEPPDIEGLLCADWAQAEGVVL